MSFIPDTYEQYIVGGYRVLVRVSYQYLYLQVLDIENKRAN